MKITKTRLKEIIKEELGQRSAPPAEKQAPDDTKIQDVVMVLKHIEKINTPQEYSSLLDKIVSHSANVRGSKLILRKLYQSLPGMMKEEEELDEMSAMAGGAVEGGSKEEEPLEEEDGFYEPHI
jgi:hypothetical protein